MNISFKPGCSEMDNFRKANLAVKEEKNYE